MRYENYTVDDFLADEYFQEWVLHPSPENHAYWYTCLQQHPEKKDIIEQARQVLRVAAAKEKDTVTIEQEDQLWQKIQNSIRQWPLAASQKKPFPKHRSISPLIGMRGIAASVVGIAVLALLYFFWQSQQAKIYTTAYQETKNIELPDGSKVVLNANSTLQVAAHWNEDTPREVWLRGEAFFEVQKLDIFLEGAKFIVHTDNLELEVLGTEFNVNDRQNKAQVVLNSGIVKLKMEQNEGKTEVTMVPGEMIEFSRKEKAIRKKTVDPEVFSAWKDNKLIFQETPVYEICQILKNTYGWDVALKDTTIANRKYTGTFLDPDPEIILKTLAVTFDLEATRNDNQIILE